jgi:hypothetical protein
MHHPFGIYVQYLEDQVFFLLEHDYAILFGRVV